MSFDLKIVSNDLAINTDGSLQTVINNDKLIQDIIKAIITPLGSNKFFKWYGCNIGSRVVGQLLNALMTQIEIERSIQETLTNIIALQKAQARIQYVSAGESIAAIQEISVLRNNVDPRQFEIYVAVLTRKLTIAETTFEMRA